MARLKVKIENRIMRTYLDLERMRCNVKTEYHRQLIKETMDQLSGVMSFVVKNFPDSGTGGNPADSKPDII